MVTRYGLRVRFFDFGTRSPTRNTYRATRNPEGRIFWQESRLLLRHRGNINFQPVNTTDVPFAGVVELICENSEFVVFVSGRWPQGVKFQEW